MKSVATAIAILATTLAAAVSNDDPAQVFPQDDSTFFATQVYPVLEESCLRCHSDEKQRGGLRLDSRGAVLRGGDDGLVVVPGDPESSVLVQAIRRTGELKMPKKKELAPEAVAILTEWVRRGVPWPDAGWTPKTSPSVVSTADARSVPKVTLAIEPGPRVRFDRDIQPLLADRCFACHGPDPAVRKAGLRFDREDVAKEPLPSGHTAIVPGSLDKSQMFQRIAAADPDDRMPPPDAIKQLSQDEIELLGRWIVQGAEWETHWAFVPPERPELPAVENASWVANPIDQFVLARLERKGLAPAPEADKRTLLRRLSLDLTGLPPTVAEVDAFVSDNAPGAYERAMDRLLASPQYGENMARYWLDAARYADTNGYHIDNMRYMWRWRDWVVDAFNANMPFDEFTVDQLAGDLLPNPTMEQRIATGFNRNHMINFEGGAIPEEYRTQYVMDRLETTATVWMGLTVQCARCHDHKFDPLTQREYYQMTAYFNSIQEQGLDGREGNAAPIMATPAPEQSAELEQLEARLATLREEKLTPSAKLEDAYATWLDNTNARVRNQWSAVRPTSLSAQTAELKTLPDDSVLATGPVADTDTYEAVYEFDGGPISAFKLEALLDESMPEGGPGRGENSNFVLTEFQVWAQPLSSENDEEYSEVRFVRAHADHDQEDLRADKAIDGDPKTGWSAEGMRYHENRSAMFIPEAPVGFAEGTRLRIRLRQESEYKGRNIGRFRLSVTTNAEMAASELGDWYASGPYVADSLDDATARRYLPEKHVDVDETDNTGRLVWTRFNAAAAPSPSRPAAQYVYRGMTSPTPRTLVARFEARQRVQMWLNGALVHEAGAMHASQDKPDVHTLRLPLHAGENALLMKFVSPRGDAKFQFTVADEYPGELYSRLQLAAADTDDVRADRETDALREHYFSTRIPEWTRYRAQEARLVESQKAVRDAMPTVMVMAETETPRPTFILDRGQYDQPHEEVKPGTPAFLPAFGDTPPRNRLEFARWLLNPEHPLTARVTVNRLWQQFFGRGLVRTAENFGTQGARPTHPELLDWLATEFVASGWDVQHMIRLMVTSNTYRQSSRTTPATLERDPENLLYARGARFRLDAEAIRDNALAISGLLVEKVGGPPVYPYQPPGLWEAVAYGAGYTAQKFEPSEGPDLHRRSLYTFWKRTSPPPAMIVFDAPNRETCTVRRARSNTPLQALVLMNDPQFVEAAEAFALRIMTEGGTTVEDRIRFAFEAATARLPSADEVAILRDLFEKQKETYTAAPERGEALLGQFEPKPPQDADPSGLAAWVTVASTILNLHETITRG